MRDEMDENHFNMLVKEEALAKSDVILVNVIQYRVTAMCLTQESFFIDPRRVGCNCSAGFYPSRDTTDKYIDAGEFQTIWLDNNPWLPSVIEDLWPKRTKPSEGYNKPRFIYENPVDKHATLLKFLELAHVDVEPPVCVSTVWKIEVIE